MQFSGRLTSGSTPTGRPHPRGSRPARPQIGSRPGKLQAPPAAQTRHGAPRASLRHPNPLATPPEPPPGSSPRRPSSPTLLASPRLARLALDGPAPEQIGVSKRPPARKGVGFARPSPPRLGAGRVEAPDARASEKPTRGARAEQRLVALGAWRRSTLGGAQRLVRGGWAPGPGAAQKSRRSVLVALLMCCRCLSAFGPVVL